MKATEAQIMERLPVWQALSEFFLDTELQPKDHERIAQTLAASNHPLEQIEDILIGEVCPVCSWNMLSIAGEWAGFDSDWLKQRIGARYGKRPLLKWLFVLRHQWMYWRHWSPVRTRILEIRAQLNPGP